MIKTQKVHRFTAFSFALLLVGTFLITAIRPQVAEAAVKYTEQSLQERAATWMLIRGVAQCIADNGFEEENHRDSDIEDGKWLHGDGEVGEMTADLAEPDAEGGKGSNDAKAPCEKVGTKALEAIGWGAVAAVCKMNEIAGETLWKREKSPDCLNGTGDLDFQEGSGKYSSKRTDTWNDFIRKEYLGGKGIEESLTNGMRYLIYSENFYQECSEDHGEGWKVSEWKDGTDKEDSRTYKLKWNKTGENGTTATPDKFWKVASNNNQETHTVKIGGHGMLFQDSDATCRQLADRINAHAAEVIKENGDDPNSISGSGSGTNNGTNTDQTCESEGGALSWFLCAILSTVFDGAISVLDGWINDLLFVDGDRYKDPAMAEAWETMRNIALLILVPMMMFMVIGTALNFGPFDPYTVKKALPRMFIAAIFIVLSLPITQFGVAVSNSVGQGIGNIIINASPTDASSITDIIQNHPGTSGATGFAAIVGVVGATATGYLTIGIISSFALVTVIALLVAFIILVMRQVLLITLMVVAPLAILVWIFPGNDKLWSIWKTTFIAMLLMYPIIAVLLASGKFVAGLFG